MLSEFQDFGRKFWIAGKGYAQINGGIGKLESLAKCELVPLN